MLKHWKGITKMITIDAQKAQDKISDNRLQTSRDMLYASLGWQGGTIQQVIDEIKRLKTFEIAK